MRRAIAALAWLPDEDVEVWSASDLQAVSPGCAAVIAAGGSMPRGAAAESASMAQIVPFFSILQKNPLILWKKNPWSTQPVSENFQENPCTFLKSSRCHFPLSQIFLHKPSGFTEFT